MLNDDYDEDMFVRADQKPKKYRTTIFVQKALPANVHYWANNRPDIEKGVWYFVESSLGTKMALDGRFKIKRFEILSDVKSLKRQFWKEIADILKQARST